MRRRLLLTLVAVVAVLVTLSIFRPWRLTVVFVESLVPSKVLLVGDSLNVGIEQNLRDRLPRWQVSADDEIGRPTATGVERLRAAGASLAPYLVLSLGTNDSASEVDAFRGDVAEALRIAGPNRCVVWATIHRDGNADDSFNGVLRAAAKRNRNVRLVEWAEMIDKHPEWLAFDGVHGNPDGYAARAEAVVAAMRSCHEAGIGS